MSKVKIATKSSIKPGQLMATEINGHSYLLANVNGNFYVTDELCTHEDWSLANGALKDHCVECPLHGSRFDLRTGKPQEEPATESLRTYPVQVEGEDIYIELDV